MHFSFNTLMLILRKNASLLQEDTVLHNVGFFRDQVNVITLKFHLRTVQLRVKTSLCWHIVWFF